MRGPTAVRADSWSPLLLPAPAAVVLAQKSPAFFRPLSQEARSRFRSALDRVVVLPLLSDCRAIYTVFERNSSRFKNLSFGEAAIFWSQEPEKEEQQGLTLLHEEERHR